MKWWQRAWRAGPTTVGDIIAATVVAGCLAFVAWGMVTTTITALGSMLHPPIIQPEDADYLDLIAQRGMNLAAWAMVFVTGVSVAVGGLGLYLIARTLQEAKRSADAAEKSIETARTIGMAQVRAYVSIDRVDLDLTGNTHQHALRFYLRNTGQSPTHAIAVGFVAKIRTSKPMVHEHWSGRRFPPLSSMQTTDGAMYFPSKVTFEEILEVEEIEWGHFIEVIAEATWVDVFDEKRVQRFRFVRHLVASDFGHAVEVNRAMLED